jgi:hypothetical protein
MKKLSVEQMVRNLLTQAISDGVVRKADWRRFAQNDPQAMTAGDLCGVSNLLATYLRSSEDMTLRDQLAAQAIQGIVGHEDFGFPTDEDRGLGTFPDRAARWAYEFADAMLRARSEAKEKTT